MRVAEGVATRGGGEATREGEKGREVGAQEEAKQVANEKRKERAGLWCEMRK
jgi:hypothetical protein